LAETPGAILNRIRASPRGGPSRTDGLCSASAAQHPSRIPFTVSFTLSRTLGRFPLFAAFIVAKFGSKTRNAATSSYEISPNAKTSAAAVRSQK
jgi:hypothetical protein